VTSAAAPGPLTPRPSFDAHVSLALAMASRPGITAVLAGAGLSATAGVPAAWKVQQELLGRAAAAAGEQPDDVFVWWKEKTGASAAYDDILFASASTKLARKDILRPFFEPTEEERSEGIKVPSEAHLALARLMRDGFIRLILTLNFDLLIEAALRSYGVEPTIVSTVDDVRGMEPLHAQKNLVWHLHGDYTNPEMLNTPDELRAYDPLVNARLDELFDQYGLLIIGWSAIVDPALRAALARAPSRRYPTTWLDRKSLSDVASRLATSRDATVVVETAEEWLPLVVDACNAIRARRKEPLSTIAAVAAMKRGLSDRARPIGVHDRVRAELDRIAALQVLDESVPHAAAWGPERLPLLEAELETWTAYVGVLGYWGNQETDGWWSPCIERFAEPPRLSGDTDTINLFTSPAVVTLYAGGVAAAAAGRWEVVCELLMAHTVRDPFSGLRVPASARIDASFMYPTSRWPSRRLASYIGPLLSQVDGLGGSTVIDAWERFEYLHWIINLDRSARNIPCTLARPCPYLRVDDASVDDRRETVPLVSSWLADTATTRQIILARLFDDSAIRLDAAVDLANDMISAVVLRAETQDLMNRGGAGWMPSGLRRAPIPPETTVRLWPS
jgi:SIR2-like domain